MDALIVIFVSGLISLFAAFAKKPWLVLTTAVGGLLVAISLLICQLASGHSFINLSYEGLNFDHNALMFGLAVTIFAACPGGVSIASGDGGGAPVAV